jgi:DNA-binding transcriptional LysR family regulator
MNGMELRQLEYFVAVVEEGSFTRAAAREHVGQSAVSVAIRALERELGARLFDRTTHHVALTDSGAALLGDARRTVSAASAALDAVAAVQGVVRGTLRIGIMQSLTVVDVASPLARFHLEHPRVDIQLRPALGGSAALADEVRQGRLDVGFVSLPDHTAPGLSISVLATEPVVLVGATATLPTGPSPVALRDLEHATFIDFPTGWGTRSAVDQAFTAAGLHREVTIEVGDVTTFTALVRAGLGLGLLPRSLIPSDLHLTTKPVLPAPSWDVMMIRSVQHPPTAAAAAFARLFLPSRS